MPHLSLLSCADVQHHLADHLRRARKAAKLSRAALAGTLAQNREGVFFQYADDFLVQQYNLAPFSLHFDNRVQPAPPTPFHGLHGVFADSLPDDWGLLLMDRAFARSGIRRDQISAMDRLSFVGDGSTGALSYTPVSLSATTPSSMETLTPQTLGQAAQAIFDGRPSTF